MQPAKSTRSSLTALNFLLDRGYRQEVLAFHQPLDAHLKANVIVTNLATKQNVAFIEIRKTIPLDKMNELSRAYSSYLKRSNLSIPVYLFMESEHDRENPKIYSLAGPQDWEAISEDQFPVYEALISSFSGKQEIDSKIERVDAIDNFKDSAYILAIFILALFALSVCGLEFSNSQLYLLVGACIVMALPHYARIKIAGLELERNIAKNEEAEERTTAIRSHLVNSEKETILRGTNKFLKLLLFECHRSLRKV